MRRPIHTYSQRVCAHLSFCRSKEISQKKIADQFRMWMWRKGCTQQQMNSNKMAWNVFGLYVTLSLISLMLCYDLLNCNASRYTPLLFIFLSLVRNVFQVNYFCVHLFHPLFFSSRPGHKSEVYVQEKVGFVYRKHFLQPVGIDWGDVAN